MLKKLSTLAAVLGGFVVSAAQEPPVQPQAGSGQPIYGKPTYGYNDKEIHAAVARLLGDSYSLSDRMAVEWCAKAAVQQANIQYPPVPSDNGYADSKTRHPYGQGFNPAAAMRLTAITDLRRRENGLRVLGTIDTRVGHPYYGYANGYQNNGYTVAGDLSFRCDVDYRGIVSNLRVNLANAVRR